MDTIKGFFKKKGVSFYFMAASLVFLMVTLILYIAAGKTEFTPELTPVVIALFALSLAAAAVSIWKEFQALSFGIYLLSFLGFLEYAISQVTYLTSILVAIDGTTFTAPFICIVLFSVFAWVCALVSAIVFSAMSGRDKGAGPAKTAMSAQ